MKADERKELETNALAQGVTTLVHRARTDKVWLYRVFGILVLTALIVGVIVYVTSESTKGMSRQWAELISPATTQTDLEKFAADHKDSTPGKVARLDVARNLLGPEGIARLQERDRDRRNKGIENIEKARDELTKLADEFKSDKTMQATCLLDAAEAELALVGIPKEGSSPASRGTVDRAVELYRKVASIVGEGTPAGEQAKKKADDLEKNKQRVEYVGQTLNSVLSPPPSFNAGPSTGPEAPKAPPGLTPDPNTPKPELPKSPGAVTPPPAPAPAPPPSPSPGATAPTGKK